MKKILKENLKYIISILIIVTLFFILKTFFYDFIIKLDNIISNNIFYNDIITKILKALTHLGSVYAFIILIVIFFFINKKDTGYLTISLIFTYLLSVILKNIFMRPRPSVALIKIPNEYSFPSGHTICSLLFYGFLIYLVNAKFKNKVIKILLTTLLILIILTVAYSRIYLKVHYFTDVLGAIILGTICLTMFINIYKKGEK